MVITKQDLVETVFFGDKSNFDHIVTALNNLHWEYNLHLFNWVHYDFVIFTFILQFKHTLRVFASVETKLNIISFSLKHYTNNRFWRIHLNNRIKVGASRDLVLLWDADLQVDFVVRNSIKALRLFYSISLIGWNAVIVLIYILRLNIEWKLFFGIQLFYHSFWSRWLFK